MLDLSIIVPSIRPENQIEFINSVFRNCTKYTLEVILVGPHLSDFLTDCHNVKFVKDHGCPARAMNIGFAVSEGKYITWSADDGIHENNGFDKALDILTNQTNNTVVVAKYKEGDNIVHDNNYYKLNNAYPKSPFINNDWWIYNLAFMHRKHYKFLGGCDSQFQTSAVTLADLAVRSQRSGANTILLDESTVQFGLTPGETGDHGPVFRAQFNEDMPNYEKLHNNTLFEDRILVGLDNWHYADRVWKHRP